MKRFLALFLCMLMLTALIPAGAEEAAPAEEGKDVELEQLLNDLGAWFSDTAQEIGEAAEEAGSSIQTEVEAQMENLDSWLQDTGKAAEETRAEIETEVQGWLEKMKNWFDSAAEDAQKTAEDAASWAEEKWATMRGTAQDAAEWLKTKAAEWGESAQSAGETAIKWAKANWERLMAHISEKSGILQERLSALWASIREGVRKLYGDISDYWSGLTEDRELYSEVISDVTDVSIREGLKEYAALIEETAEEHGAGIPEEIQGQLDAIRQYAEGETEADVKLDDGILESWLVSLGVSPDEMQVQLKERYEKRMTRLSIEAGSAALSKYMTTHGLTFSSAALRAQDRLNRYASGSLDMTEEQVAQAKDILKAWCKDAGVDEKELIRLYMDQMEAVSR